MARSPPGREDEWVRAKRFATGVEDLRANRCQGVLAGPVVMSAQQQIHRILPRRGGGVITTTAGLAGQQQA
jgi:hypothetical protein